MSVTLWLALLLQLAAIALLRLGLGKGWLRRPVTLLVLASVVYDGLSPVLLSFPSVAAQDIYRNGLRQGYADTADLVMSAGMLALAGGFLLAGRGRQEQPAPSDAALAARVLDWRILALACAPLALLTYEGRGYNAATAPAAAAAASVSVTSAFFVILVTLASAAFLLRHGTRWLVPAVAAQSVLLAAAGERIPVIAGVVALMAVLARAGMRPSRGQVMAAAALTVVAVTAIAGVRAHQGRGLYQQDNGLQARVTALGEGVTAGQALGARGPGLAAQAAARLDGTSFAGAVLQARALRYPGLDPAAVPESLLLTVPHAAWSSKPEQGDALNPYQAEIDDFGLQQVNYLPTLPGLYIGYMPVPWLLAFLAFLGAAWGAAERWLLARCTPARLVLLAAAAQAALRYEAGLPAMLVALRAAAVIAAAAWAFQSAARRRVTAGLCVPAAAGCSRRSAQ